MGQADEDTARRRTQLTKALNEVRTASKQVQVDPGAYAEGAMDALRNSGVLGLRRYGRGQQLTVRNGGLGPAMRNVCAGAQQAPQPYADASAPNAIRFWASQARGLTRR